MSNFNFISTTGIQPEMTYESKVKTTNGDVDKVSTFTVNNAEEMLASNMIFSMDKIDYYNKFNRYGFIDTFNTEHVIKEFLFFTKPDLHLLEANGTLTQAAASNKVISDAFRKNPNIIKSLQQTDVGGVFMKNLSNRVKSKLDLPSITAESNTSTPNINGTEMSFRSHSKKSKNAGFDFTLSFSDTDDLEIYSIVKVYDEVIEMYKSGDLEPFEKYITGNIDSTQFSVFKFLIGSDGETILFGAKVTGVYFTDVPVADMNDPTELGKITLSFHGHWPEDSNAALYKDFNFISPAKPTPMTSTGNEKAKLDYYSQFAPVWNGNIMAVDNRWVSNPYIIATTDRVNLGKTGFNYRLKWLE